ncbi:MAG: bleomycin resistance protein [Ktedonobacterales bacterium]
MTEKMIPLLQCQLIDETVDFYRALGFEITFYQKSPYAYCAVRRGGIEMEFFGTKSHDPATSYGGCYVLTDDVDTLYQAFRDNLKAHLGKIPTRGLPRIGQLKDMSYGVRQFVMTDPGGNSIRVGQPISQSFEHSEIPKEKYARAVHLATLIGQSKEDYAAAARIIDRALASEGSPPPVQLLKLLVLRAEMSAQMGDTDNAAHWLDQAATVQLTDEERDSARDDLLRANDLKVEL